MFEYGSSFEMIRVLALNYQNPDELFYRSFQDDLVLLYDFFVSDLIANIIVYLVIPGLLVLIIVLIIMLFYYRKEFEIKETVKLEIDRKLNDFLTLLLFGELSTTIIKYKIEQFKKEVPFEQNWCKSLILKKLISIKQNISGLKPNLILVVYKTFGFQKFSSRLIQNKKWHQKSLGIYHYQMLEYKIKKSHIKGLLKDSNKFLQSNALIALIALSDEKFDFLNNYKFKISQADELKILDIIYQKKAELPTSINSWFFNTNSSVVLLAIKLMVQYRKSLSPEQVVLLLSHPEAMVRKETLLAIRLLNVGHANEFIIKKYKTELDKRNKISSLKTLASIGDPDSLSFVINLLETEQDLELKFEIVNCLNQLDPLYFDTYVTSKPNDQVVLNRILLHVNNPLLK
jgi:hypothetical protein